MIALDRNINNKLAELWKAGEELKLSVNTKIDSLMKQAIINRLDPNYEEQIKIYTQWLDQITEGIRRVHSFFDPIWIKIKKLVDKIFLWMRRC